MLMVGYVGGVCLFHLVDLRRQAVSHRLVALPIFVLCAATDALAHYYPETR